MSGQSTAPTILRPLEFKLYPNADQIGTLETWLRRCCWTYNRCLEQRIKAYKRRKESVSFYDQQKMLTAWRERIELLRPVPQRFLHGALSRIDRGMKAFFRRCKVGEKPGFPRFRSHQQYNSLEYNNPNNFILDKAIRVPFLGRIIARGQFGINGKQKLLRVIRRASGWYAQVVIEQPKPKPLPSTGAECGIDVGLESFLTLDSGEKVGNPRLLRRAEREVRTVQRQLARCQKGSHRRLKVKKRFAKTHERIARQRKGFCHRTSRDIVNRFDRIAVEALNVGGMAKGYFTKSILDAAWGLLFFMLAYKAANAGREFVKVNARGTSQECPHCGAIRHKELSERTHHCVDCGLSIDRDQAAAMVVRDRAFRRGRGGFVRPLVPVVPEAEPMKREDTG